MHETKGGMSISDGRRALSSANSLQHRGALVLRQKCAPFSAADPVVHCGRVRSLETRRESGLRALAATGVMPAVFLPFGPLGRRFRCGRISA